MTHSFPIRILRVGHLTTQELKRRCWNLEIIAPLQKPIDVSERFFYIYAKIICQVFFLGGGGGDSVIRYVKLFCLNLILREPETVWFLGRIHVSTYRKNTLRKNVTNMRIRISFICQIYLILNKKGIITKVSYDICCWCMKTAMYF